MKELHFKVEDYYELYKALKRKMESKINYYGGPLDTFVKGEYVVHFEEPYNDIDHLVEKRLSFYYKFCRNDFLVIQVGSSIYYNASVGEKLAALSNFYEVLSEEFGEPIVFYTTKDEAGGLLSMHWSFINKDEDIKKFKEGTYFDDIKTDKLIIIGESRPKIDGYELSDIMRKRIVKQFGVPFELLPLVDENIEDFIKVKTGKKLSIPENIKIEDVPVTSFEKKLSLKKF